MKTLKVGRYAWAGGAILLLLTGCGGPQPQASIPGAVLPSRPLTKAAAGSCASAPCMYVTNGWGQSITAYAANANGNANPLATIGGGNTGLGWPYGIAMDSRGEIYVADYLIAGVSVFAAGSNGDVSPVRTIGGPKTGLIYPSGLALDGNGNVYAKNGYYEEVLVVTVYGRREHGNAAPIREIVGEEPPGPTPSGIATDSAGDLYVAKPKCGSECVETDKILIYGPKANGHPRPLRVIAGSRTGLNVPSSVTVDNEGKIYVTNSNNSLPPNTVTVYAAGAHGNVAPMQTISGPDTGLNEPDGIAVDAQHNIYVANYTGSVLVFAAGASGDAVPIQTIVGSATGLQGPEGIAVH